MKVWRYTAQGKLGRMLEALRLATAVPPELEVLQDLKAMHKNIADANKKLTR